jgi:hypothetical protein
MSGQDSRFASLLSFAVFALVLSSGEEFLFLLILLLLYGLISWPARRGLSGSREFVFCFFEILGGAT